MHVNHNRYSYCIVTLHGDLRSRFVIVYLNDFVFEFRVFYHLLSTEFTCTYPCEHKINTQYHLNIFPDGDEKVHEAHCPATSKNSSICVLILCIFAIIIDNVGLENT